MLRFEWAERENASDSGMRWQGQSKTFEDVLWHKVDKNREEWETNVLFADNRVPFCTRSPNGIESTERMGMLHVTARATKLMADHFKNKKKRALRLYVKLGGCGIRTFGVAFEKPKASDQVFEIDGFQYVIDKVLLEHVEPVKVDSDGFGFRISGSGIPAPHGCGNCGFMCSDGSRCSGDCAACPHKCAYGLRRLRKMKNTPG